VWACLAKQRISCLFVLHTPHVVSAAALSVEKLPTATPLCMRFSAAVQGEVAEGGLLAGSAKRDEATDSRPSEIHSFR